MTVEYVLYQTLYNTYVKIINHNGILAAGIHTYPRVSGIYERSIYDYSSSEVKDCYYDNSKCALIIFI